MIWTRGLKDWTYDQKLFSKSDRVVHLPCVNLKKIVIRDVKDIADFFTLGATYAIFTSVNGVELCLQNSEILHIFRSKCQGIYTVGEKARRALEQYQLQDLHKGSRDYAQELGQNILESAQVGQQFFLPGAAERAFDFEKFLQGYSYRSLSLNCYKTLKGAFGKNGQAVSSFLDLGISSEIIENGVLCFASPSAVIGYHNACPSRDSIWKQKPIAVAIGKTTYASCRDFSQRHLASTPNLQGLVAAAREILDS